MKRFILAAVLLLTCGCAVHAEETAETYQATVIESDGESALLQIEDAEESTADSENGTDGKSEKEYASPVHKDGTFRFGRNDDVLIIDDERMVSIDELCENRKTVVTFSKGKAVIQLLDDEETGAD